MRTITTIVEAIKIAAMVTGATIGIVNEGMDKVKANSKLCDAATKESFKDLLTSNAECTKELSRAMIEYPLSLFMDSTTNTTKAKAFDDFQESVDTNKPKEESKDEEVVNTNTNTQA